MTDGYTPSIEEMREGYIHLTLNPVADANSFDRGLAAHDAEVRAECAAMVRGVVEEAMREAYASDPGRYPNPAGLDSWHGMRMALALVADKIEGKRE